jgi:hypothetical protein
MVAKIWTAAELEAMTPEQRHEVFEASVVTDLDEAPRELLTRVRARLERRIAGPDASQPG